MANEMRVVIDDQEIVDALNRLKLTTGRNLDRVMRRIGVAMVASTRLRFKSGTAPDGSKWFPSKRALARGGQTLRDTGRLQRSLVSRAESNAVAWGTNVVYAAPLHFGSKKKTMQVRPHARTVTFAFGRRVNEPHRVMVKGFTRKVNLPPRQILGVSEADKQEILGIVSDELNGAKHP